MKTIERVRLSQIKPNESNPRADFGDIAALADSIRATGGEPVNPIVCVRDANALFIVDGERRWRALKEIYGDRDQEVSVTVVDGWGEAAEVLAMLGTDDKKRLSEAEKSKGYQLAFDLGTEYLNDTEIAMSTGAKTDDVMNARLAWRRLGKADRERYAQCSLDQFAAAQEFEGKEFEAVLKAKPESWRMKAQNLRAERARRAYQDKAMDICAAVGIEWVEAEEEDLAGYELVRTYWHMDDEKIAGLEGDIAVTGATAMLRLKRCWRGEYALAKPAGGGAADEDPEELAAARARGVHSDLKGRLAAFLAFAPSTKALRRLAADTRRAYLTRSCKEFLVGHGMDPGAAEALVSEPATMVELFDRIDTLNFLGDPTWGAAWLAAARKDGFEPSEDEEWLAGYLEENAS